MFIPRSNERRYLPPEPRAWEARRRQLVSLDAHRNADVLRPDEYPRLVPVAVDRPEHQPEGLFLKPAVCPNNNSKINQSNVHFDSTEQQH